MTEKKYQRTIFACFIGYIVQAIVNNFVPLLFVTFQKSYDIPLSKITILITLNFLIQLVADAISAPIVRKIGYKWMLIFSHILSAVGFVLLTILPEMFSNHFLGIIIAICFSSIGGGFIEVVVSPTVEATPTKNKERAMSLLHSFYCWGHVAVVLLSTIFFTFVGIENWKIMAILWTIVPIGNIVLIAFSPIKNIDEDIEHGMSLKEMFKDKMFWIFAIMIFAGACGEQSIAQWVSSFTEISLGVTKTQGDLIGTMGYALLMGLSRVIFAKFGEKMDLYKYCLFSSVLCIFCYVSLGLTSNAIFSLICCGLCGFSVGIFWPAAYSKAAATIKNGGTLVFAMLALFGDVGCSAGPTIAGEVSSLAGGNMRAGMMVSAVFPVVFMVTVLILIRDRKRKMIKIQ